MKEICWVATKVLGMKTMTIHFHKSISLDVSLLSIAFSQIYFSRFFFLYFAHKLHRTYFAAENDKFKASLYKFYIPIQSCFKSHVLYLAKFNTRCQALPRWWLFPRHGKKASAYKHEVMFQPCNPGL